MLMFSPGLFERDTVTVGGAPLCYFVGLICRSCEFELRKPRAILRPTSFRAEQP